MSLAFYQTYGLREDLSDHRAARINVGTYDFAVHRFIPRIAYAVTLLHRKHEPAEIPSPDLQRLTDAIAKIAQRNRWDLYRKKAGIGTYTLAGLLYILPPIGPFKLVDVKGPTAQTEADYVHSVLASVDALDLTLRRFTPPPTTKPTAAKAGTGDSAANSPPPSQAARPGRSPAEARDPLHPLPNRDLDTGLPVQPTAYRLTDDTYATLLHRIALAPKEPIPPGIKSDILAYYANLSLPFATKRKPEKWAAVQADLVTLQSIPTSTELDPFPTYDDAPASP